jgi:predicted O-methyltransferase YrrM
MVRTTLTVIEHLLDSRLRPVMVQKIRRRLLGMVFEREQGAKGWAAAHAADHAEFCKKLDVALWNETDDYVRRFREEASRRLAGLPTLGGGGNYHLLYFLTRFLQPETVLETGVAAGYSTHAVLTALERNGKGHLWSSDFPYFRLPNPERYVGVLVPDELKHRWTLSVEGDSVAVPRFVREIPGGIDLFHYDSDKTYSGRSETFGRVLPRMSPKGVVLVDDIQDNFHFRDITSGSTIESRIFEFEGKYCGLLDRGAELLRRSANVT